MPRGHAPKGGFYSAHKVDNAFFEPQAEEDRDSVIRLSMPFLHSLIYSKIEEANISRGKKRLARVSSNTSKRNDETEGKSRSFDRLRPGIKLLEAFGSLVQSCNSCSYFGMS